MTLVDKAGVMVAQYVVTFRKLSTVILSFLVYGKPVHTVHILGGICFMTACLLKLKVFDEVNHRISEYCAQNPRLGTKILVDTFIGYEHGKFRKSPAAGP